MTKHNTLPGLDDVLELARIEKGRWSAMHADLVASGVPLNDGSPQVAENWQVLFLPGLRKIWHESMDATEATMRREQIFPVETSVKAAEDFQGIGEMGPDAWNQFDKTGRVPYDGQSPTWKQTLTHRRYAAGMQAERELMDDNLYPGAPIPRSLTSEAASLGRSAAVHRERSAANVFNNAFTDSGTDAEGHPIAGADGVGLVSTAHPLSPGSGSVQSNEFNLALTGDNLSTVKLAAAGWTDDKSVLAPSQMGTLLVPRALEDRANVIVGSELDPTSANNAINPNKGKWKVEVWDWLTDPTAWFTIDEVKKRDHLIWLDRIKPEFKAAEDFDTMIAKWRGYYRFSRGWDSWRWVAGSKP